MNVFSRVETKYLITKEQYENLVSIINDNGFYIDKYKRSTIQTLYYDTLNDMIIRRSIDKPIFKEKIRVRNYGESLKDKVYLEVKRKYKGTVYKRRIETSIKKVNLFFNKQYNYDTQIGKEINSFRDHYIGLAPKIMIISEREAYYNDSSDLRFTFDFDIRYRNKKLSFDDNGYKEKLLKDNEVLLEIKSLNSYPMWLISFLNSNKIFKTSFSKYGNAYIKEIMG